MEEGEKKDPLGDLEKKLYQKEAIPQYARQKLERKDIQAPRAWREEGKADQGKAKLLFFEVPRGSLLRAFYISVALFVVALFLATYFIWIAPRVVTPKNIDIAVEAPTTVSGGEEVPFRIFITNDNKVSLSSADLIISFPDGVFRAGAPTENRFRKSLGAVGVGERVSEDINLVFLGEENTDKEFVISLEYRTEGSSAIFSKEKTHKVVLTTSPVSLSFDVPEEVNAGEDFAISVKITSNSRKVLEDFIVTAEYPFGYSFKAVGSNPAPTFIDNVWVLGDLPPESEKRIQIVGRIEGAPQEEKAFKISVGTQDARDERAIGVLYNSFTKTTLIKQPFIGLTFSLNGNIAQKEVAVSPGEGVEGEIAWSNTTESRILNGEVTLSISGEVVDESTVIAHKGFYSSQDNIMVWNQTTDRTLTVLEPGGSGRVRFSFETIPLVGARGGNIRNPEIVMNLSFHGERVSPGFPTEPIIVTASRKVKISSAISLDSYGLYSNGPFENDGPIPPRAESRTTYTIVWSLVNSSNDITDAYVKATLPPYVKWLSRISPQGESVTFNELTGEVVWNVEDVDAGVGIQKAPREVAFQVEFLPSQSHIGTAPEIVSESEFYGRDVFTGETLTAERGAISTLLGRDPLFNADALNKSRVAP